MSADRFAAMGCVVEVGGATAREAEAIERIFQARDRQFSRFREDSELTRVNRKRMVGRLLVRPVGLELNLNGVVKGQTVDEAVGLLSGDGFVTAGGDYAGRGEFDVALPGGDSVRVTRGGLATSGTTKRRWLRAGVWQHHLIDPRSGRPAESPWAEVTVNAGTCLEADVAAKAAFLLGFDGPAWLDARRLAGRFLAEDGPPVLNDVWERSVADPLAA